MAKTPLRSTKGVDSGNRSDNKLNLEHHVDLLHVRHYSWSCATFAGPEAVFQSANSGDSTACGHTLLDSGDCCG